MLIKGMIFAAGTGTRLRPITDSIPKALVEVGGVTMLEHTIAKMERAGINEIVVNTHHFASQIQKFVACRRGKAKITISDESELLLDTGGGLANASKLLAGADTIVLHNADILTNFSLKDMLSRHLQSGADATLLAWHRDSSRRLLFSPDGRLKGWIDIKSGKTKPADIEPHNSNQLAFGGVHIVNPKVIETAVNYAENQGNVFSLTPFYVDNVKNLDIRAFTPEDDFKWFDIGSIEKLTMARSIYNHNTFNK